MNTNTNNTAMKELSLDELEQVNGGWVFTVCFILVWGTAMTVLPYVAGH